MAVSTTPVAAVRYEIRKKSSDLCLCEMVGRHDSIDPNMSDLGQVVIQFTEPAEQLVDLVRCTPENKQ